MRELSKLLVTALMSVAIVISLYPETTSALNGKEAVPPSSAVRQVSSDRVDAPALLSAWLDGSNVSLNWRPVTGATGYLIKRSNDPTGPYSLVGSVAGATYGTSVTASTYAYTDNGPFDRSVYRYVVTAVNPNGESDKSEALSVIFPPAIERVRPEGEAIEIVWPNVQGALSYNVKRSTEYGGPYNTIRSVSIEPSARVNVFRDNDVRPGVTYYYVLSAMTDIGESPNSAEFSAVLQSTAPTNLMASNSPDGVTLNWTSAAPDYSYNIKRSAEIGGPYTTIAAGIRETTFTDTNVQSGLTYEYVVTAGQSNYESASSNTASASIPFSEFGVSLIIKLEEGIVETFQLDAEHLNAFIGWFEAKSNGIGPDVFEIEESNGELSSRKRYILYKRIIMVETATTISEF
ncbi:MAG: cellulosome anchoring protein cohesin region [Paenibacillus sp.]|nr:cellulosome anchoring protein cohesin region [Paenibacillus sp.]